MLAFCMMLAVPPVGLCGPEQNAPRVEGWLSHYGEMPTEGTIAYRISVGDLPADALEAYDVFFAVTDCKKIGKEAWFKIEDSPWLRGVCFDCAGHVETVTWMEDNSIIAEIDYWSAKSLEFEGGVSGVIVWDN